MTGRPGLRRVCVAVATGFYLSYIPETFLGRFRPSGCVRWTGAGVIGTLEGWALVYWMPERPWPYALAVLAAVAVACWVGTVAESELGRHDDPRIVVDEVVGYWVAAAWLPRTPYALLAAFVLFRFLDTVKLPPYRWLERLPGGAGVVLDDVGAGLFANLILHIAWRHLS